jgi:pimeloyl-ACP methyl ester carboxylesterase
MTPQRASYILTNTGRAPVVLGWSQGGVITGLLAATAPQLVAGVGLFSVPEDGFSVPTNLLPVLRQIIIMSEVDRFLPTEAEINEVAFGPLMSSQAEDTFYSLPEPDSVLAIEEAASPLFFNAALVPAWPTIRVPALVADGALDPLVGPQSSQALFDALGSKNKHLVIFPRNSHGWLLEDNHAIPIFSWSICSDCSFEASNGPPLRGGCMSHEFPQRARWLSEWHDAFKVPELGRLESQLGGFHLSCLIGNCRC